MAGTPGYGPWPPYGAATTPEAQRAQLEATLRALRDQRPGIVAEIAEYLFSLVMQQQVRDPVVIAAFRRLYDHDQQIQQAETGLRTFSASYPPVSQPAQPYGAQPYTPPTYNPPMSQQPSWTPPVSAPPPSAPGNVTPSVARSEELLDTRPAVHPPPIVAEPAPRPYTSQDATRPTVPRAADPTTPVSGTDRVCMHCKTPLRPKDTICPVCGLPAGEMPAAATCVRCGNILKPTDASCPVCGTPR